MSRNLIGLLNESVQVVLDTRREERLRNCVERLLHRVLQVRRCSLVMTRCEHDAQSLRTLLTVVPQERGRGAQIR